MLSQCRGTQSTVQIPGIIPRNWAPSNPPKNNPHPLKILNNDSPTAVTLLQSCEHLGVLGQGGFKVPGAHLAPNVSPA